MSRGGGRRECPPLPTTSLPKLSAPANEDNTRKHIALGFFNSFLFLALTLIITVFLSSSPAWPIQVEGRRANEERG